MMCSGKIKQQFNPESPWPKLNQYTNALRKRLLSFAGCESKGKDPGKERASFESTWKIPRGTMMQIWKLSCEETKRRKEFEWQQQRINERCNETGIRWNADVAEKNWRTPTFVWFWQRAIFNSIARRCAKETRKRLNRMPIYLRSSKVNRWQIQRRFRWLRTKWISAEIDCPTREKRGREQTNYNILELQALITSNNASSSPPKYTHWGKCFESYEHPSAAFEEMPKPHNIKYTMFDGLSCIWPLQYTPWWGHPRGLYNNFAKRIEQNPWSSNAAPSKMFYFRYDT